MNPNDHWRMLRRTEATKPPEHTKIKPIEYEIYELELTRVVGRRLAIGVHSWNAKDVESWSEAEFWRIMESVATRLSYDMDGFEANPPTLRLETGWSQGESA